MPTIEKKGFIGWLQSIPIRFKTQRTIREKESMIIDTNTLSREASESISKFIAIKREKNLPFILERNLLYAQRLIDAGLPFDALLNIMHSVRDLGSNCLASLREIHNFPNHLYATAKIGKELYSPEIIYANSFQEMIKNIRILLNKPSLKERARLTTDYRYKTIKRQPFGGDISDILKGCNLTHEEICEKMNQLDREFEYILAENNPEKYIRSSTALMAKFVSIHPFSDGNGRTSRMFLSVMLARKGIFLPSIFDNYFERRQDSPYTIMESVALQTDDYTSLGDYIINRVLHYNGGKLELADTPLIFPENIQEQGKSKTIPDHTISDNTAISLP